MTFQVPNARGPLGLKTEDDGKDPAHLAKVRALPCCICQAFGITQRYQTEAHHVIHGRHSQRRTPDRMAIPLCVAHHRGVPGVVSVHGSPAAFKSLFGEDRDWIAGTLDRIEAEARE